MIHPHTIPATDKEKVGRKAKRLATLESKRVAEALRLLPFTPPNDHSPFLELPPEIRKMILEGILVLGVVRISARYQSAFQEPCKKPFAGKKVDLRIARVNKQLKEESEAIAYANNHFRLTRPEDLQAFVTQSSRPCSYLKHVEFGVEYRPDHYLDILSCLAACTNIRTISIPHHRACTAMRKGVHHLATWRTEAYDLWHGVRKQFAVLRRKQEQEGRGNEFPQLITVAVPLVDCRPCVLAKTTESCSGRSDCKTTCGSMAEHCDELSKQYNTMLATYFEDPKQGFELLQKAVGVLSKGPKWKDGESDRFIE